MSLARLVVNLTSNTRPFTAGINTARGTLRGLATTAKTAFSGIAAASGPLIGVFAGFKAISEFTNQFSELDRTAKLAAETGFGASAIAGLNFAAEQSGASVEVMNKGLQRFVRRIGEVKNGSAIGAAAIRDLGIDSDAFANASPENALFMVAERLKGIADPAEKAAAAYRFFGRQGQDLLNVLNAGEDGLRGFIAEAESLGLGFSTEELARVEAANDAVNRIKRSMGALFGQLAVTASPAIEFVSTGMLKIVTGVQAVTGWVTGKLSPAFKFIGDTIRQLIPVWEGYKAATLAAINTIAGAYSTVFNAIGSIASQALTMIANATGATFSGVVEGLVVIMATAEFAWNNFGALAELAFARVLLGFVQIGAAVSHLFTGVMPALFAWFADNWRDIFFTAFDLVSTVFINIGTNIRQIMGEIWDFIASGGRNKLELSWTPLTEGFVNTIKELPNIPDRPIGELERRLAADVDRMQGTLNEGLQATIDARLDGLDEFRNTAATVPGDAGSESAGDQSAGEETAGGGRSSQPQFAGALAAGTAAAFSAILKASGQGGTSTADKQLAQTQKQTEIQKKTLEATERAAAAAELGSPVIESFAGA